MSKATLTPALVNSTVCPADKRRVDIFDVKTKGLILEVRPSGGKTFYLRYRDTRGRSRQVKMADARDVSLSQARQLADVMRAKIAMGEDPVTDRAVTKSVPTLEQFFYDRYLVFAKGYKRSWDIDESVFRNHVQPKIGKKRLDEVTKDDIARLLHERKATGAAAGSANRIVILCRYMFNLALKWETPGVTKNPASGVQMFDDPPTKERYLSTEEAQRLYQTVCLSDNEMLRYIIPMLILTGARKREVLDAKWEDFDFKLLSWRIPFTKTGRPRHIPMSEGVISLLKSVPRLKNCPYVFANPKTLKPFVSVFHSWDTARKLAGLSDVRMHDLRHSFASFLVNNGRSLYEVQKLLGHTQIKTTQRYAHLSHDTLMEAASVAMTALPMSGLSDQKTELPEPDRMVLVGV